MARLTEAEIEAARAERHRKQVGAPSTQRKDAARLAAGKLVPRPTVMDLESLARVIEEEEGAEDAAEDVATGIVIALRARGWTCERIAERFAQPVERVRSWLTRGLRNDMVSETEAFLDNFVVPMAADLAHQAIAGGDTSMAKDILKGRGPLRKVLKEPGPTGGAHVPTGPPVLNLQINVLPGTPGATVAVGAVAGIPRGVETPITHPRLDGETDDA